MVVKKTKKYGTSNPKMLQELGVTGFIEFSGRPQVDELKLLKGKNKFKYFNEMVLNDAYIGANHKLVTTLSSKSRWDIKPGSDSKKDQKAAEAIKDIIFDIQVGSFNSKIKYIASGLFTCGFTLLEKVFYKRPDGKFGIKKLASRSQLTISKWKFDENDEVLGVFQKDPRNFQEIYIPIEKLLHFKIEDGSDNPEGVSLVRNCVIPYHIKKSITNFESIRLENDCRGIRKYKAPLRYLVKPKEPNQALESFQAMINQQMQNVGNGKNSAVIVPGENGFDFDILNTQGSIVNDTNIVIERCNRDIAISLLSDFVLLGHKGSAIGNIGQTKVKIFSSFVGSLMDDIRQIFNKQLIPQILEMNNIKYDKMPELIHTNLQELQTMELAVFLQSVSKNGTFTPSVKRDNFVSKMFLGDNCPDVTEEEFEEYHSNNDNNSLNNESSGDSSSPVNKTQQNSENNSE